jgi:hypothetical protein
VSRSRRYLTVAALLLGDGDDPADPDDNELSMPARCGVAGCGR